MTARLPLYLPARRGACMNDFIDRLSGRGRGEGPAAEMGDGALVIDCRGCDLAPLPGSDECIRCMVERMRELGGADRIVLRTGRDTEVAGPACRAIRDVASMRRWLSCTSGESARCRGCPVSRERVMDIAWASFPKGAVFEGRKALREGHPGRDGCAECVMRTSRALDQMEAGLARVMTVMSGGREAGP